MSAVPSSDTIERCVRLAGRAPSLHNSQPWHWVFDGSVLRLYSVAGRLLPVTDDSGRQLLLSCGVALGHLRAALAASGWHALVAYFPDPAHRRHVATIDFVPSPIVTDADLDQVSAIERRHTDRLPFAPPEGWTDFAIVLRALIDPADAIVTVLPAQARPELARASRMTAALRRHDSSYQAELRWWAGHELDSEGIPPGALVSAEERGRVALGRDLPVIAGPPRRAELGNDRAALLVLSTAADSPADLVRCGEALSTVLLECTVAGYATCPLTHMTELPRSRFVLRELIGGSGHPQVLIRVGQAPTGAERTPTPRRPLTEIFEVTTPGRTH
ncbi:Acg family FMN-binding oxidoreductase [Nocardia huaxiensis]|uniref:Nitroreductase family protein n=1 Tax=Nocardia huaxiensis TaxID=2755382 RepID=A0A7D6VFQ1_9NOCA|nr:nitroreductase family protein [Nocardia huaxiensis]QLY28550.1 nitroreductase family protein [Nocardia huaxiensis]UFS97983.1 nitroreductase family protein [Nocardia huaxiensis]